MMTTREASPPNKEAAIAEVHRLLQTQTSDYTHYCKVLELSITAAKKHDDEKLTRYGEQEAALIEKLSGAQQLIQEIRQQAGLPVGREAALREDEVTTEALRQQAIGLNARTQEVLGDECGVIKQELAAIRTRLQTLEGGRMQGPHEPLYIDIKT